MQDVDFENGVYDAPTENLAVDVDVNLPSIKIDRLRRMAARGNVSTIALRTLIGLNNTEDDIAYLVKEKGSRNKADGKPYLTKKDKAWSRNYADFAAHPQATIVDLDARYKLGVQEQELRKAQVVQQATSRLRYAGKPSFSVTAKDLSTATNAVLTTDTDVNGAIEVAKVAGNHSEEWSKSARAKNPSDTVRDKAYAILSPEAVKVTNTMIAEELGTDKSMRNKGLSVIGGLTADLKRRKVLTRLDMLEARIAQLEASDAKKTVQLDVIENVLDIPKDLSTTDQAIISYVRQNLKNPVIAELLGVTVRSIQNRKSVLKKLGLLGK